jgi:hypothetical protein
MSLPHKTIIAGAAGFAILVAGGTALASHGRVGLWSVTMTVEGQARPMPDMSQLPPEAQAHMRAMMGPNGNAIVTQHCMTTEEVMSDVPHLDPRRNDGCTLSNVVHVGHTMSADMTCTKNFQGAGHIEFTYDSDTHYVGHVVMNGEVHGHQINHATTIDGRWLAADCGSVTH